MKFINLLQGTGTEVVRILKHDKYVDTLYSRIKPDYDSIQRNVPIYSKRRRLIAEIDILAEKEGKYDVYEVKCSHRIYKAKKQLHKIKKIFHKESKKVNNIYFYCGESKLLQIIDG
ncbi:MAG: hypothetical protein ACP5N3_01150 [Candidatus Nanoarchaeia archaeon]